MPWLTHFLSLINALLADRSRLALENIALRQQITVLKRSVKRAKIEDSDRVFWILMRRMLDSWRETLLIVEPETVIRWHRKGFGYFWNRKSKLGTPGRPPIDPDIIELIQRMSKDNVTWGSPRIRSELALLGRDVSESTVAKYMVRHPKPPSQNWRTFLANHMSVSAACDFFVVPSPRPAIAQDRLSVARDGSIVYRFRKRWRNGKQAVVMDPMTFLSRLAAQVPPPRFHVLSYYGVLGAAASRRDEIVPGYAEADVVEPRPKLCAATRGPVGAASADAGRSGDGRGRVRRRHPERMLWCELVLRVFLEDVLRCPCGGRRRVLAMIFNPVSIERVLRHLGLPHEPLPRAPPRPMQVGLPFATPGTW